MADWDQLAAGLAAVLPTLARHDIVVVTEPGAPARARVAQFVQLPAALLAEVGSDADLPPELRMGEPGAARMAELGWRPPEPPPESGNWSYQIAWPATSAQYRRVAEMVVGALRDAYRIEDAGALRYSSFNALTNEPRTIPGLGLDPADER